MNNAVTIEVGAPLLRPGLTIRTTVSERYATQGVAQLMGIVRSVNERPSERMRRAPESLSGSAAPEVSAQVDG